jgi:hypothetical protein
MTLVYAAVGFGGGVVFIVRGAQDRDVFFYWLAAANAVFWLGLLVAVLVVDNRRRHAMDGASSRSSR